MNEQLSLAEAKRLSVKKYEMHIKAGGEGPFIDKDPELKELSNHCGFCERHKRGYGWDCSECEINMGLSFVDSICLHPDHPYYRWGENPCPETAQAVLDLILTVKVD